MIPIDLKDKVAIVTGSTQGIGLGIARMLSKAGCHVAGCGMSENDSEKVATFNDVVSKNNRKPYYQKVDIRSENNILQFVDSVVDHFGRIDILISNAGKNMFTAPQNCSSDFWDENNDLNLKSHWLISKACYSELKKNHGFVLLMTSNHAFSTIPDCFPYNVSKAAIVGLVNSLAVQWGPEVRVIGMAPGFIETEGGKSWFQSFPDADAKRQQVVNIHPVKKLGTVDEIGAFCAFLASEYAEFITGTTFLVDGGRSALMQDI